MTRLSCQTHHVIHVTLLIRVSRPPHVTMQTAHRGIVAMRILDPACLIYVMLLPRVPFLSQGTRLGKLRLPAAHCPTTCPIHVIHVMQLFGIILLRQAAGVRLLAALYPLMCSVHVINMVQPLGTTKSHAKLSCTLLMKTSIQQGPRKRRILEHDFRPNKARVCCLQ